LLETKKCPTTNMKNTKTAGSIICNNIMAHLKPSKSMKYTKHSKIYKISVITPNSASLEVISSEDDKWVSPSKSVISKVTLASLSLIFFHYLVLDKFTPLVFITIEKC
jgi:hypothetical protein